MSCLTYLPQSDEETFKHCTRKCGFINASEDQQYFTLSCIFCPEKFLYFDAFILHMQTNHQVWEKEHNDVGNELLSEIKIEPNDSENDYDGVLPGAEQQSVLEPQMVMIKGEIIERGDQDESDFISGLANDLDNINPSLFPDSKMTSDENNQFFGNDFYPSIDGYGHEDTNELSDPIGDEDDAASYDDMVEESLLRDTTHTGYIKDRKMIRFLIDSYRRNPFLWNHLHPQFRDRTKRHLFLEWIINEFEKRYNIKITKDAVTRKWDNLRTVYKRECNRMAQENINISSLWYFKDLQFINSLSSANDQLNETMVKETVHRRRFSAIWNDLSTNKLLNLVRQYPCFFEKTHPDYRVKERRGEALQSIANELQQFINVSSIQISKRISQLRFDYSKQKMERLQCEQLNKVFVPTYTYYDQMLFMDDDIAPYRCEMCPQMLHNSSEMSLHMLSHQNMEPQSYQCNECNQTFSDERLYNRHRQLHNQSEKRYQCDLCTASFRDKDHYDDHVQRHNDELLLPGLAGDFNMNEHSTVKEKFFCDICGMAFNHKSYLNEHRLTHSGLKCDFRRCGKMFESRQDLTDHLKFVHNEEYRCDVCGKIFKSSKNLANHRQIHDAVKRYVCKICGSAFAQAAGLYLHKRRHNRPNSRISSSK